MLLNLIKEKYWQIDKVILTHGHFDHSYQAAKVADTLNIPVVVNEHAKDFMANDDLNLASKYHQHVVCPKNVILLKSFKLSYSYFRNKCSYEIYQTYDRKKRELYKLI